MIRLATAIAMGRTAPTSHSGDPYSERKYAKYLAEAITCNQIAVDFLLDEYNDIFSALDYVEIRENVTVLLNDRCRFRIMTILLSKHNYFYYLTYKIVFDKFLGLDGGIASMH